MLERFQCAGQLNSGSKIKLRTEIKSNEININLNMDRWVCLHLMCILHKSLWPCCRMKLPKIGSNFHNPTKHRLSPQSIYSAAWSMLFGVPHISIPTVIIVRHSLHIIHYVQLYGALQSAWLACKFNKRISQFSFANDQHHAQPAMLQLDRSWGVFGEEIVWIQIPVWK